MSYHVADFIGEETRKVLQKNMTTFARKVKIERLLSTLFFEQIISCSEMEDFSARKGMERHIAEEFYMRLMQSNKSTLIKLNEVFYRDGEVDIAHLIPDV